MLFGTAATSQSHVGEAGIYAKTTAQRFFRRDAATRSPGNEKNKKHAEPTAFRTRQADCMEQPSTAVPYQNW